MNYKGMKAEWFNMEMKSYILEYISFIVNNYTIIFICIIIYCNNYITYQSRNIHIICSKKFYQLKKNILRTNSLFIFKTEVIKTSNNLYSLPNIGHNVVIRIILTVRIET